MFNFYRPRVYLSALFYRTMTQRACSQTKATSLLGQYVRLELISEEHREALRFASNDRRIWTHHGFKACGELFNPWFDTAVEKAITAEHIVLGVTLT